MSPVALVALKKMMYAGRGYLPGEAFEARDASDASVLTLTGLASFASKPVQTKVIEPEPPEPFAPPIPEPVVESEPEAESDDEPDSDAGTDATPVRRRRTYKRRDMTAER